MKKQGVSSRGWRLATGSSLTVLMIVSVGVLKGSAAGRVSEHADQGLTLTVRVYNYARVSAEDMATAERVATRIFQKTGVELSWVDCPLTRQEVQQNPACQSSHTPTEIILRIVPMFPQGLGLSPSAMGYALPTPPPHRGYLFSISYTRAQAQLQETQGLTLGQLLGHGIAHEIGHLLLGTNSHSPAGLMCAHWNANELVLAAYGQFNFSREQADSIRGDVRTRTKEQEFQQMAEVAAK